MRTSALFIAKKFRIFQNLWCVRPHKGGGGLIQCKHFADNEEGGLIFLLFVQASFMDNRLYL